MKSILAILSRETAAVSCPSRTATVIVRLLAALLASLSIASLCPAQVACTPPPLIPFPTIKADATGQELQSSMIWADSTQNKPGVAIAFRKTFELPQVPAAATLHLFADARYVLWVNGAYVERGPARFQPNGPEYDSVSIARHLNAGHNAVVVFVYGNLSGGKVMRHVPGFTAMLEADGKAIGRTDASWKWSNNTRYRQMGASWANLGDSVVDSTVEDGDWTQADYNDSAWKAAEPISSEPWGALTARRIPLLREKPVPVTLAGDAHLPVTLRAGEKLAFSTGRIVQAYPVVEFEAGTNTELSIEPYGIRYLAKAGPQKHFAIDTRGITAGAIVVKTGKATITGFRLIERLYPFDRVGSFHCNDEFLNKLWTMCARSGEILCEDSYVDCADRERVEWMDDDPPGFDIVRTVMASPGPDGKPLYSDPRLLEELVRRTALTLQPEGWVKAHTCSDRYDIHAKMEDRACEWVAGIRRYYEATGNAALLREIWPAVTAQMDYFLARRTPRGLVSARDWVVWGNPVCYMTGEGTTLNVFVQRALSDTALLAGILGDREAEKKYGKAAADLAQAINTVLWNEAEGCYYSGYFTDADVEANIAAKRKTNLPFVNNLLATTLHANTCALERGVVPVERRERVIQKMLEQSRQLGPHVMIYYYLAKELYGQDRPEHDLRVLNFFRKGWANMVKSPLECSWETLYGGSKAHIYGMVPGYFLNAYVLGVRRDAPVAEKKIRIEPHLGDLTEAEGVVVTEFGPVPVSWKREGESLRFQITAPEHVETILALPCRPGNDSMQIDGKAAQGVKQGQRTTWALSPGAHQGIY